MTANGPDAKMPAQAGTVYAAVIQSLLAEENARKASLEQRALAVITSSGGLITLILALAALLWGKDPSASLAATPRALLVTAVGVFVAAAAVALVANSPRTYWGFNDDDLDQMIAGWRFDAEEAAEQVAALQAERVKRASAANQRKARQLQAAVILAMSGLTAVAAAIITTIA